MVYFRAMKKLIPFIFLFIALYSYSQDTYKDSLETYIADYIKKHEVVLGKDKEFFRFYPINEKFKVTARFEKAVDSKWFSMETSGPIKQTYKIYGTLHFTINNTSVKLNIYQSKNLMAISEYKDHLFIPFTDDSSGEETYAGGRYIDLGIGDIVNNKLELDFNKAYNPYCAYVSGKYNCPIPPKENHLAVAIHAGEKMFAQSH
jgi:uncharacterized protein